MRWIGSLLFFSIQLTLGSSDAWSAPNNRANVVTRAVGQVADYVLTSREVILAGVIEKWLFAIQDRPSETLRREEKLQWFTDLKSDSFREQVSRAMVDIMVNFEAESLSVAIIKDSEVQLKSTRFMVDFAGFNEWKRLGPMPQEVQMLIRRKLRSRAFLQFKTETSGVMVNDEEALQYFEKNRMKFGNYPFQQFKNSIKEVLAQERLEGRLKDWFEVLKKKHRVRFLNPPG